MFEATRFRGDQTPSKLDCVFTNEENFIENLKYIAPLGLSDHIGLHWNSLVVCQQSIDRRLLRECIGNEIIPLWLKHFLAQIGRKNLKGLT